MFFSKFLLVWLVLTNISCNVIDDISKTSKFIDHKFDFEHSKNLINDLANLIYQRFEFNNSLRFQFFLESSNMASFAWDILKYKFAKKILEKNSTFLMIFGGSSVTAGHDNYYNQSYPLVFERRMSKIFKSLGIDLKVHNIAQGASNCRPSNFCYEAMGGFNADFFGWEQSYNCGRDRAIFELIARIAYLNKAVVYYSASGAFSPTGCAPSKVFFFFYFTFLYKLYIVLKSKIIFK
jgi:hypothetical protein